MDFYEAFCGRGRGVCIYVFSFEILWDECFAVVYCLPDLMLAFFVVSVFMIWKWISVIKLCVFL